MDDMNDEQKRIYYHDVLKKTSNVWHENLLNNQWAIQYLENRKISMDVANKFKLGFAVKGKSPIGKIKDIYGNKVEKEIFDEFGLLSKDHSIERYHNRIIVPYCDIEERIIGFTARTIIPQRDISNIPGKKFRPRYMTTKTPIILQTTPASHLLYHGAKNSINDKKSIIIVEGVFDALSMHSSGFTNTIGLQGNSQRVNFDFFSQMANDDIDLVFMFDNDKSEESSKWKVLQKISINLQDEKFNKIKFVNFPQNMESKDAADILIKHNGCDIINHLIENSLTAESQMEKMLFGNIEDQNKSNSAKMKIKGIKNRCDENSYVYSTCQKMIEQYEQKRKEFKKMNRGYVRNSIE